LVAGGYDFILFSLPDKRSPTVIRSGRITIVGRSNAGKSALFNPR
jgi:GTP-binding protein EngB required for normal cell division